MAPLGTIVSFFKIFLEIKSIFQQIVVGRLRNFKLSEILEFRIPITWYSKLDYYVTGNRTWYKWITPLEVFGSKFLLISEHFVKSDRNTHRFCFYLWSLGICVNYNMPCVWGVCSGSHGIMSSSSWVLTIMSLLFFNSYINCRILVPGTHPDDRPIGTYNYTQSCALGHQPHISFHGIAVPVM